MPSNKKKSKQKGRRLATAPVVSTSASTEDTSSGSAPRAAQPATEGDRSYVYRPDEFGCFATRFIPRHTLIIAESPSICGDGIEKATSLDENGTHTGRADDDAFLRDTAGLGDDVRARIWALHDQFNSSEKRLLGIVKSNAYLSTDEGGLGLYTDIARFNHSCAPNLGYGFNGWQMRVYTTRDIEAGEELTTCYHDMVYFHRVEARQFFFKAKFNFDCSCRCCAAADHQSSDKNREKLEFLVKLLQSISSVKSDHLRLLVESIKIMKTESLEQNLVSTYKMALEWARKLGEEDTEMVKELNLESECLKLLELSKGTDHSETINFRNALMS